MGIWKKIGKGAKVAGEIAFPRRAEAVREIIRPIKNHQPPEGPPKLKTQPTAAPTRKVKAVGISGVIAALLVLLLGRLDIEVDAETATALAGLFIALAAYLTKSREGE